MTRIDPILPSIYRISAFNPQAGIAINHFLIADDQPALIHTGTHPMHDDVRKAIAQVLDPKRSPTPSSRILNLMNAAEWTGS